MAFIKKPVKEEGIIVSKFIKPATGEFPTQDGRIIPAQPERPTVIVVSACDFDEQKGFDGPSLLTFKVDLALYNKMKYSDRVKCKFFVLENGRFQEDSIELIQK